MSVSTVTETTTSTNTGVFNTGLGELGGDAFLQLLVTQLRFQDPTKPLEDKEFIAQLAQFSNLEQVQEMNQQLFMLAQLFSTSQAMSLVGRNIEYRDANGQTQTGQVTAINFRDGLAYLVVGEQEISPSLVSRVW